MYVVPFEAFAIAPNVFLDEHISFHNFCPLKEPRLQESVGRSTPVCMAYFYLHLVWKEAVSNYSDLTRPISPKR